MSGPSYIHWPNCGGTIADHGDSWCGGCGEPISGNEGIDLGYWQREPEIAELEAENERLLRTFTAERCAELMTALEQAEATIERLENEEQG